MQPRVLDLAAEESRRGFEFELMFLAGFRKRPAVEGLTQRLQREAGSLPMRLDFWIAAFVRHLFAKEAPCHRPQPGDLLPESQESAEPFFDPLALFSAL